MKIKSFQEFNESKNVYHGSPHKFDKFSSSFNKEGEGANEYGYGLYFTDKKEVAEYYADTLDKTLVVYIKGEKYKYQHDHLANCIRNIYRNVTKGKSFDVAKYLEIYDLKISKSPSDIKDAEYLETLKQEDIELKRNRNIYHVELHKGKKANGYVYIRWDKPISKKHKSIIDDIVYDNFGGGQTKSQSEKFHRIDKEISRLSKYDFGSIYRFLSDEIGSDKELSEQLLKRGIDGIQVPVNYTMGEPNETDFNYVVFDENAITINKVQ